MGKIANPDAHKHLRLCIYDAVEKKQDTHGPVVEKSRPLSNWFCIFIVFNHLTDCYKVVCLVINIELNQIKLKVGLKMSTLTVKHCHFELFCLY